MSHRSSRPRTALAIAALLTISVLAAACGARGGENVTDAAEIDGTAEGAPATAPADDGSGVDSPDFGTVAAPCGDGDLSVADGEQQGAEGTIQIGVPNDRGATIRPGLQKPIWDASVAFAAWCNAQGGIGGLQIELIDMDGKLFEVESAMQRACGTAFALVGGGNVQDDLQFSGKEGSDFHKCGMIDIPAYAVSTAKSMSNGQVQPVPNPTDSISNTWFRDFAALYPDQAATWVPVWGNLPSLKTVKTKQEAIIGDVEGMEQVGEFNFPPIGTTDWTPLALSIIDSGATSMTWTGESPDVAKLLEKLRDQGWEGRALLETNQYDRLFLESGSPQALEGTLVRMAPHMLEEADEWPAVRKYLDLVDEYVDGGEVALLGMQSMSAWLLFVTAASACGEANDGVLTRDCIMEQAAAVSDWTGGGLHAPQDPDQGTKAQASTCSMLAMVEDGAFVRRFPEVGGEGDDGDGFHCPADGLTEVTADVGQGEVDPSRGY
ncbi:ABC transporter substrate-binding protein [Dermatobacter hominis]|uniref:ABC transporter substrate-binding protein n=1 Tax=Dermatobacter hominis TaxID=2884263 RepID=UPI001D12AB76|nr:ABC transporter substrate-binding protein [Dermatobacter hominis]UDY37439.1 ABC transporter substrate-binding protein [Dermatobacter hominis]